MGITWYRLKTRPRIVFAAQFQVKLFSNFFFRYVLDPRPGRDWYISFTGSLDINNCGYSIGETCQDLALALKHAQNHDRFWIDGSVTSHVYEVCNRHGVVLNGKKLPDVLSLQSYGGKPKIGCSWQQQQQQQQRHQQQSRQQRRRSTADERGGGGEARNTHDAHSGSHLMMDVTSRNSNGRDAYPESRHNFSLVDLPFQNSSASATFSDGRNLARDSDSDVTTHPASTRHTNAASDDAAALLTTISDPASSENVTFYSKSISNQSFSSSTTNSATHAYNHMYSSEQNRVEAENVSTTNSPPSWNDDVMQSTGSTCQVTLINLEFLNGFIVYGNCSVTIQNVTFENSSFATPFYCDFLSLDISASLWRGLPFCHEDTRCDVGPLNNVTCSAVKIHIHNSQFYQSSFAVMAADFAAIHVTDCVFSSLADRIRFLDSLHLELNTMHANVTIKRTVFSRQAFPSRVQSIINLNQAALYIKAKLWLPAYHSLNRAQVAALMRAHVLIEHCTFSENERGLTVIGQFRSFVVSFCHFERNVAIHAGAAILSLMAEDGWPLQVVNCSFDDNGAGKFRADYPVNIDPNELQIYDSEVSRSYSGASLNRSPQMAARRGSSCFGDLMCANLNDA